MKWKKHKKVEGVGLGTFVSSNELLCPHGVGHEMGVHGCDGCCSDPSFEKEINDKVEIKAI